MQNILLQIKKAVFKYICSENGIFLFNQIWILCMQIVP